MTTVVFAWIPLPLLLLHEIIHPFIYQPDESLSDDFLFPMTSRLSYASSPESDLDLCPDPSTATSPLHSQTQQQGVQNNGTNATTSGIGHLGYGPPRGSALKKSNSDPSIATHEEEDEAGRGAPEDVLPRANDEDAADDGDAPGYNAPPPYSPFKAGYEQTANGGMESVGGRRRLSHGGDGKYGFPSPLPPMTTHKQNTQGHQHGHSISHSSQSMSRRTTQPSRPTQNSSQPHPNVDFYGSTLRVNGGSSNDFISQQQRHCSPLLAHSPPHSPSGGTSRNPIVPDLPPRVDRTNKPGRSPSTLRSATERLFGSSGRGVGVGASASTQGAPIDNGGFVHQQQHHSDGNYMNAQRGVAAGSSLERPSTKGGHDSMSSSYDSFNRLGPNAHDDLKSGNGTTAPINGASSSLGSMQRLHDPYRFTRSTAQPIRENQPSSPNTNPTGAMMEYGGKYSREHRSKHGPPAVQPTATTIAYKPVPPPKPKNYRPPQAQENPFWSGSNQLAHPPPPPPPTHSRSYSAHIPNGGTSREGVEEIDLGVTPGGSLERNHAPSNMEPPYSQSSYSGGAVGHPHLHMQHQRSSPMAKPPRGQFYYNVPPPREYPPPSHHHHHHHHHHSNGGGAPADGSHGRELSGLDLTNREQRGSAFELYKKPNDPRLLFVEHGALR